MSKLLAMLKEKPLTLVVHLPENNIEMAQAAEKMGADALMVSQGYDEEKVLDAVSIPVGLDLAASDPKSSASLLKLDFDFINFHPSHIEHYEKFKKTKIAMLDEEFTLDKLMSAMDKKIDAIDAAIIPIAQSPKELVVGDLQNYIAIALSSNLPVLIPTQRNIKSSEVPIIWDTGAKGLILTKVVLGDSVKSVSRVVAEYRVAIDNIEVE